MRGLRDAALGLVSGLALLLLQAYAGTDLVTATWRALAVALAVAIGAAYLERRQRQRKPTPTRPIKGDAPPRESANVRFTSGLRPLLIPGDKSKVGPGQEKTPAAPPETIPVSTDKSEALVLTWRGERMWNFRYRAWMFLLRYQVQNRTDGDIDVLHTSFQGPRMADTTPEIYVERERIAAELGTPPKTIPARQTIGRWYLGEFAWDPDIGEPAYEIRLKASNGGHEYGFRRVANPKQEI